MMMKNLGKFVLLFFIAVPMYASLSVSVDSRKVTEGESVVLTIKARGETMDKLQLVSVCDEDITSSAAGTNITSINGSFSKENTYRYTFTPTQNCTIAPIEMTIDGKKEVSEPIDITVSKMVVTKDSPFILEMVSNTKDVRVGEPFEVVVRLKMRHGAKAVDSKYTPPKMKNIWIKKEEQGNRYEEGDYTVTKLTYVLAVQKPGLHTIGNAQMKIASRTQSRDAWGQWMPTVKWRSYFSNELEINATALPNNTSLVGDLKIEAKADKTKVQANEAVNVELVISGRGNFEDIGSLKPYVSGVSVFEEEPKIDEGIHGGYYQGSWHQKFTFVGDGNYEIPAFSIRYFDTTTQSVKTLQTQAISVEVIGGAVSNQSEKVVVEKADSDQEEPLPTVSEVSGFSYENFGLGLFVGAFLVFILMMIPWKRVPKKKDTVSLADEKSLILFLMPYINDAGVKEMIELLEARVYNGADVSIDKKVLKAMVKKYQA